MGRDFKGVRKNMTPEQRKRLAAKTAKLLEQMHRKRQPRKRKTARSQSEPN